MEAIVEARKEYMYMLQECVVPEVLKTFMELWEESDGWARMDRFIHLISEIQTWGDSNFENKVENIKKDCDWFEKLIEASIVVRVQIMNSVKVGRHHGKLKITVPSSVEFIRKVFKISVLDVKKNPSFMKEDNYENVLYDKITKAIDQTVRSYVPLQSIISRNLSDDYEYDTPEPPSIPEPEPIEEEPVEEEEVFNVQVEDDDLLKK
jgi:hypothetical protein